MDSIDDVVLVYDFDPKGVEDGLNQFGIEDVGMIVGNQPDLTGEIEIEIKDLSASSGAYRVGDVAGGYCSSERVRPVNAVNSRIAAPIPLATRCVTRFFPISHGDRYRSRLIASLI